MAYDNLRNRTILFGGFSGGALSDTWEWDGTAWAKRASTGPAGREAGDRAIGRRTLPIAVGQRPALLVAAAAGLFFVPASLVLPRNAGYGGAYFLIALLAQMAVLVVATWMLLGKVERVSTLLKVAMVVGLIALVAGKVA